MLRESGTNDGEVDEAREEAKEEADEADEADEAAAAAAAENTFPAMPARRPGGVESALLPSRDPGKGDEEGDDSNDTEDNDGEARIHGGEGACDREDSENDASCRRN